MEITAPPQIGYAPDVSRVMLADGTAYPASFLAVMEMDNGDHTVSMSIEVDLRGHASCRELKVRARDGGAVTAIALRSIRLGELTKAAVRAAFQRMGPDGTWVTLSDEDLERATRPRVAPADRVTAVARVYNRAQAANQPPLQTVMRELFLERATASRAIRAAKDLGYITTREKGR